MKHINYLKQIWRYCTYFARPLPNTFIVGAQKAGTSSLHNYLCQHPKVTGGIKKELHYFSGGMNAKANNYNKGLYWYRSHFPVTLKLEINHIILDSTPMYLFHPEVPERVKRFNPDSKIIILLRNPVERAISHYFHTKKHLLEPLDIEKALITEKSRLERIIMRNEYSHSDFRTKSYCARGEYIEQVRRYYNYFPAEQIKVICSEELFSDPQTIVTDTLQFLGVKKQENTFNFEPVNVGSNKAKVSDSTVEWLENHFKPYNEKLYSYLGKTFNW